MKRLYLQIYLTVIVSLVAFATAAGVLWWLYIDQIGPRHPMEVISEAAQSFPATNAPQSEQQEAVNQLAQRLRGDAALYAPDRTLIAGAGRPFRPLGESEGRKPPPQEIGGRGPRSGWVVGLADGRSLAGRASRDYFRARRPGPLLMLILVALAVGVGAYPVVRRVTRRLEKLKTGVDALGAGDLSARVTVEGRDEVAQLATSFNRAAGQIEVLVGAHKTLLANASHELRTPLARIRMAVELMKDDPLRRAEVEQDIAELDALIEEILLASRLDALEQERVSESVDLLGLAAEECARYEEAELDGERVSMQGDSRLLRRLMRNLLENARRHGAPPIEMRVRNMEGRAEIRVCDHGAGIPEPEREKVFEPFYRRTGSVAGAGLGLALVRQIARRHGGDVRYSAENCFEVRLPLSATRP